MQGQPPKVNSRTLVDWSSRGLRSKEGAEQVVNALKKKSGVKHLLLAKNDFGDEGMEVIMEFLCSPEGRKLPIEEINLSDTRLDDGGLDAISKYLTRNQLLVGLHLPNNRLKGRAGSALRFVEAINSSRLRSLNLTYNTSLGDGFLAEFLPRLTSPSLRELKLSSISLTTASGAIISSYLTSDACLPLRTLKLNANHLDLAYLYKLQKIMEESNFSLTYLEVFANYIAESNKKDAIYLAISRAAKRNMDLARFTRQEALAMLPISRSVLLESMHPLTPPRTPPSAIKLSLPPKLHAKQQAPVWSTVVSPTLETFPFRQLPIEIQQQILSQLCSHLSACQRVRIFNYASSPETLPSLKLGLAFPSSQKVSCIGDPTATMMSGLTCSGDPKTCLGPGKTLICGREEKRNWWLELVGCDRYELTKRTMDQAN